MAVNPALARSRFARWLWLLLPLVLALGFERLIVGLLGALHRHLGGLDARLLFYLPFLSAIPPLVLLLLAWRLRPRDPAVRLPLASRETIAVDVFLGAITAAACVAAFVGSLALLKALGIAGPDFRRFETAHHLYFSTVGAMLPAVAEELYFRGFLAERFRDLRLLQRITLASASFALWHVQSPSYLLHTFLIGLILGWIVQRTGRLLPAMLAHALANMAAVLLIVRAWV